MKENTKFPFVKYFVMMYYTLLYDENATEPHCNCPKCPGPETRLACLTIDHTKPRIKKGKNKDDFSGDKLYKNLVKRNFPGIYQVLCFTCNFTKGKHGKCAHLWNGDD